ncbi:MAG: hypothetical protein M3N30_04050 [Bacteroidota bacterium]|nr:hypothetical protein [Bacteroidota bacterium]
MNKTGYIQLSKRKYKSTYKGEGYTIILITTPVKEYDEGSLDKGTLEIANGQNKVVIKVHGEAGC